MVKKKLYVHIGHYKTGTSALQNYLHWNADLLRESGYYYPNCARPKRNKTNHGHLSLGLAAKYGFVPPPWYDECGDLDSIYRTLHDEIAAIPEKNIVLSSEEFVQLALLREADVALGELKERLIGYDVRIVLFIREPLSLLISWYNQVNKGPFGTRNFMVFFAKINGQFLSQRRIWRRFANHFGVQNVILRTYKHHGTDRFPRRDRLRP